MQEYIDIFMDVLKNKYAAFNGRASRQEFWTFNLITYALIAIIAASASILPIPFVTFSALIIIVIGSFIPLLALSIRRLHDTDKSAWWLLISLIPYIGGVILFIFYLIPGTEGPNRFGDDPYGNEAIIEEIEQKSPFNPK